MFTELYAWVGTQLATNDIFAGVVGGSVIMSALYSLRSAPARLWDLFLHQYSCYVVVYSEDDVFDWLNEWLSRLPYAAKSRRLRLNSTIEDESDGRPKWSLSPGPGNHFFVARRRMVWLNRAVEEGEKAGMAHRRRETITLRVFARNPKVLSDLIADAKRVRDGEDRLDVLGFQGCWRTHDRRAPRSLDSVVLPEAQVSRIVADAEWFLAAQQWYLERGVPYRRGYLLSGPPGCGKTSLVVALASHLARPIYVINLGSLWGDNMLFEALSTVPPRAVVLIEDIDAAQVSREPSRPPKRQKKDALEPESLVPENHDDAGITMSGLLNAIDGVLSKDGRLLVMTTNYPDALDPALIRPGRVDRHEHIGPLDAHDAARLFLRFFPDRRDLADRLAQRMDEAWPGAELQGLFMLHNDDAEEAVETILKERKAAA